MNTPDTEVEKAELAVFWDEIAQHLPKSIERSALGDEKIFRAFATAYPKMKKHLLTSRDTYWKERVRKEVERIEDEVRDLKRRSDSSTYLYGQGESNAYETVLKLLAPITNEDNLK